MRAHLTYDFSPGRSAQLPVIQCAVTANREKLHERTRLARRLNTADAVAIGMSAMIGSGVFVAIAPASASAGAGVLLGIAIAAFVAYCNAASSAELAAVYPESGGTYVYGRKQLGPFWGWLAGWGFVVGKLASCAAAALTFGFYFHASLARPLAIMAVAALTLANYRGIRNTAKLTRLLLTVVLAALAIIVFSSAFGGEADVRRLTPVLGVGGLHGILQAAGIMFFAFAGYARIATLGEEVREPRKTIPRAIPIALFVTLIIYIGVAASALSAVGAEALANAKAPLAVAIEAGRFARLSPIVRTGATVATLSVLLSLMAGISRTLFAMAGNKELPVWLSAVHPRFKVPHHAEIIVACAVSLIALLGDVRFAIGFSSFTVLIYYAIANASAWTLSKDKRLWPRPLSAVGFVACIILAFSLPQNALLSGMTVMAFGAVVYLIKNRLSAKRTP